MFKFYKYIVYIEKTFFSLYNIYIKLLRRKINKDMDEKEEKKEVKKEKKEFKWSDKPFDVEEFYRKLGVWLLFLLLVMIAIFGSLILITQKEILNLTEKNFIHKSTTQIVNVDENFDVQE